MCSHIAITGATGYLGAKLAQQLSDNGHSVVALTRRNPGQPGIAWREFDLTTPVQPEVFEGIDTLIHAAWVLSGADTGELWQQNVIGSRRLIESAKNAGISNIMFVSSMSAYFGTRQVYGLMKLAVERTTLDVGGVVVRPGLVYGAAPGGMGATLTRVASLPIWPWFRSARLFLAHEDDVATAVGRILDSYDHFSGHVIGLAHAGGLGLTSVLARLARRPKPKPVIYVPARAVTGVLYVLESAGVQLPFRSDSLLGLVKGPTFVPGQELLRESGITFRQLTDAH